MERLELARLADADDIEVEEIDNAVEEEVPEEVEERPAPLAVQRREAILGALRAAGAARVLDLGCGQGQLVAALLKEPRFTEIVGRGRVGRGPSTWRPAGSGWTGWASGRPARVTLFQGSLAYTDARLKGYDAAVLSEVIEHLDLPRLPALEYAVFGSARPRTVVVTTPNVEYNVRWESLPAGHVRHADHRFEWTRAEFAAWAAGVAERVRVRSGVRARRTRRPRGRAAHPDGRLHPHRGRRRPGTSREEGGGSRMTEQTPASPSPSQAEPESTPGRPVGRRRRVSSRSPTSPSSC